MSDKEVNLDSILAELGSFGRYQIRNYFFILLPIVFSAMYGGQYLFNAAEVNYRCRVPECEASPPQFDTNGWGAWAFPDSGGRCEKLLPLGSECTPDSFHMDETVTCQQWIYENTNSIVTEFDLACEEWKRTLVGTIHSVGLLLALPLTGYISDTFGRRTAFIATAVASALVGTIRSFSTSYNMYLILELLEATTGSGVYSTGFILALEMVNLNRRVIGGNIISCTYALGQVIMALAAWAFPYWRTLTRVIYIPSFVFIFYYFCIEESVRWLLAKGRRKEAQKIVFKAAAVNKKVLSEEAKKHLSEDLLVKEDNSSKHTSAKDNKQPSLTIQVLKSRILMTRLCICSFWWITVTFVYYGLSINSVSLAGNSYVNYILISLVEIPGYFFSMLTLDRFGRKSSIMGSFLICGISLLTIPFIPDSLQWLQTTLNMLGKLCISMVFSSIYIYTSELYPTNARHRLLGVCSMVGRIGSITAPQTPLLMAVMDSLPYILFGVMALFSGFLTLFTPETLNVRLPDTVQQAEDITASATKRVE